MTSTCPGAAISATSTVAKIDSIKSRSNVGHRHPHEPALRASRQELLTSRPRRGCSRCEPPKGWQHTALQAMRQNVKIGVGIIGAGNIAGHHIHGYLLAAEHAEVAAIADVDADRARSHAAALGKFEVFQDYRELMASPRIDAVDICLPHHLHKD